MKLAAVLDWKGHVDAHCSLGFIHEGGELRDRWPEWVDDTAPLLSGTGSVVLNEANVDECADEPLQTSAAIGLKRSLRGMNIQFAADKANNNS